MHRDRWYDSGCTNPITTREVIEDLKMKLNPVNKPLVIIQADRSAFNIIRSAIIFLEAENIKGRRMIECAVIEGNGAKEILINLEYLKKLGILHESFPHENLDDSITRKYLNKSTAYYSDVLNLNTNLYAVNRTIREPSQQCKKMREEILTKWSSCFKEKFE